MSVIELHNHGSRVEGSRPPFKSKESKGASSYYLLLGELVRPGSEHVVFILDPEFSASFFFDALLPKHVLGLENERF